MRDIRFSPCSEWAKKLADFHANNLPLSDVEALEAHLALCQACTTVLLEYRKMDENIHHALSIKPLTSFASQLLQLRLRQELEKSHRHISEKVTPDQKKHQYPRISVVIPIFNEAENLRYILPRIPSNVSEVILVDGQSTDDSLTVARQLLPSIHIEQAEKGKGEALKVGFKACKGEIIVMLDGDGSVDPNGIPRLIEALLAGNDFAKGSRFIRGGGSYHITPLRLLGSYGLNVLANKLFRMHTSDLCSGFNAFWRYCLDHIEIDCDGLQVNTLITLSAYQASLKIVEVPYFEQQRISGRGKLRIFRDGWFALRTIFKERNKYTWSPSQQRYQATPNNVTNSIRGAVFIESWKNLNRVL